MPSSTKSCGHRERHSYAGMDGIVLLSHIKAQQPNLPVIITTLSTSSRRHPRRARSNTSQTF